MTAQGLKFGSAAHDYHRGRPGWPAAVVDHLVDALELRPSAVVVDLAAGTGRLTQLLAQRFKHVIAVEPLAELRAILAEEHRAVETRAGLAERLPLEDESIDAIFVAEAFHWFNGRAALREAARVLVPGGGLSLLWNVPVGPWRPPIPEPARQLVRAAMAHGGEPGGPRLERGDWRDAFADAPFAPPAHAEFEHVLQLDRAGLIANTLSISSLAGLGAADREKLRSRLAAILPRCDYQQTLRTDVFWTRRGRAR